jgi:GTPase SAR1 family protein
MAHFLDHTITNLKLTLVGDGEIGKSCLILQYLYGDVSIIINI